MKTWFIALPFLCAVNLAQAADIEAAPAADKMESASAPANNHARPRMHKRSMKRLRPVNLPHGDLRYCLERKTNEAIIYCAEERRTR